MKKQILNVGKALNKNEQQKINGGRPFDCPCPSGYECAEFREGSLGYWHVTGVYCVLVAGIK